MKKSEIEIDRFQEILLLVKGFESNFTGFYKKGSKAAGTRLRKNMQTLRAYAKSIRFEVQNMKKDKQFKKSKKKDKDQISIFQ